MEYKWPKQFDEFYNKEDRPPEAWQIKDFISSTVIPEVKGEIAREIGWLPVYADDLEKYLSIVKNGDMDKMYDYGFNKCKERILSLLNKK